MIVTPYIPKVREVRWSTGNASWGLVPTMGYLHEGHLSLVRLARSANDNIAVSIFVNPTQFTPDEDLATYPRDLEKDLSLLEAENVDLVFAPSQQSMYPDDFQTELTVEEISKPLEGYSRPAHFQGVATIVAKLFNIFEPSRAYFGQKDYQQTMIIKQMVLDLNFDLEVVVGAIVRESDGLAMSSRNMRLRPEQRAVATVLHDSLILAEKAYLSGESTGARLRGIMSDSIASQPLGRLDYVSVADLVTLTELDKVINSALLSLAVFFDSVRLIDNLIVRPTFGE